MDIIEEIKEIVKAELAKMVTPIVIPDSMEVNVKGVPISTTDDDINIPDPLDELTNNLSVT